MWCAQTAIESAAIATIASTIERYPNSGLRLKTGTTSEMIPNAGSDDDVDLGVAEEPEQVLPQDRVAAGRRVEEASRRTAGR